MLWKEIVIQVAIIILAVIRVATLILTLLEQNQIILTKIVLETIITNMKKRNLNSFFLMRMIFIIFF